MAIKNIIKDIHNLFKDMLNNKRKLIVFLLYIFMLGFCFLVFQQADLYHTSTSSYAYLRGHIIDFYDYNKPIVGGNDYYALIYIIFAIWNIPLKIFGLMHTTAGIELSPIELLWTKLFLVVCFFATAYVIYKIAEIILAGKKEKAKWMGLLFATSPIAIFAVFSIGQYDIIGLLFTMIGMYYYLKKDYLKFSIAFSLAISLKLFAIMLFIPLLLLSNKKILQIIKYLVVGVSATFIQIALYYNNPAFRSEFFSLASGVVDQLQTFNLSGFNSSPYLIIIFCIICIYAYIKKAKDDYEFSKIAVLLCIASYASLFSTTIWHPQWLIILMPFFALSYIYINDKGKMCLFDIVGMFAYIYVTVNFFSANIDVKMAKLGILRSFFPYIPLVLKDFFRTKYLPMFEGVFFIYLFSPILVYYFGKNNKDDSQNKETKSYFYSRVFLGTCIFVVPSLLCMFMPKNIAIKLDKSAYSIAGLSIDSSEVVNYLINNKSQVEQTFYADNDYLKEVDVRLGTFQKKNECNMIFSLYDNNMDLIAQSKVAGESIIDNEFYKFNFASIKSSKGNKYTLKIQSDGDNNNNIAVWGTKNDVYKEGTLKIADKKLSSDIIMKLYYDMQ